METLMLQLLVKLKGNCFLVKSLSSETKCKGNWSWKSEHVWREKNPFWISLHGRCGYQMYVAKWEQPRFEVWEVFENIHKEEILHKVQARVLRTSFCAVCNQEKEH
ncbi:unnamed protein product [Caretta caretta]